MKRRSFLTGAAAASLLPGPALAGGWPSMTNFYVLGGWLMPIRSAYGAALWQNAYISQFLPANSPGTGLVASAANLVGVPSISMQMALSFDYLSGWQFSIPGVQTVFTNSDIRGASTVTVEFLPPGTSGYPLSSGPILIIRLEEDSSDPASEAVAWAVPDMINWSGSMVAHNVGISVSPDSTNTFTIQVVQDNRSFNAFLVNPHTYARISGAFTNFGPAKDAFFVPWARTAHGDLHYSVGNRAVPTSSSGVYIPGGQFDGLPNTYYALHGGIGRVVFDPNPRLVNGRLTYVDIRHAAINNVFVGPITEPGTPGDFTVPPLGGAGLIWGTPGNGPVPPIYLIGGVTPPPPSFGLPNVTLPQNNAGILPGYGNASFGVPIVPPGSAPFVPIERLYFTDSNGNPL